MILTPRQLDSAGVRFDRSFFTHLSVRPTITAFFALAQFSTQSYPQILWIAAGLKFL